MICSSKFVVYNKCTSAKRLSGEHKWPFSPVSSSHTNLREKNNFAELLFVFHHIPSIISSFGFTSRNLEWKWEQPTNIWDAWTASPSEARSSMRLFLSRLPWECFGQYSVFPFKFSSCQCRSSELDGDHGVTVYRRQLLETARKKKEKKKVCKQQS